DMVGRFGGDEFVILTEGLLAQEQGCLKVTKRIITSTDNTFYINQKPLHVSCNIGIATFPSCGKNADELLKHADIAMHNAKLKGKNHYSFYTEALNKEISEKVALEHALRD